jgi:hypothetical protein
LKHRLIDREAEALTAAWESVSKGETARQEPGMLDGVLEVVAGHHRASVRPIKCGDDVIRFVFHPTE